MLDIARKPSTPALPPDFLSGGGHTGERLRAFDWTRSALGPAREWPQGLKTALRIILASGQPMCALWGTAYTVLYNDACRVVLGDRHASMLGQAAPTSWSDFWQAAGHRAELAVEHNEGSAMDSLTLFVDRGGRREHAQYGVTFSPLPGDPGALGGVLCTFTDVTATRVGERRLRLLEQVGLRIAGADTVDAACALAVQVLAGSASEMPFAAIYRVDALRRSAVLVASAGLAGVKTVLPTEFGPNDRTPWPFTRAVVSAHEPQLVAIPEMHRTALPAGVVGRPPREAAVVPLGSAGGGRAAVLVTALDPTQAFDSDCRRFFTLLGAQVAVGLASAQARHEEAKRNEIEVLHTQACEQIERHARIETELRESERRYRDLVDTLPAAVYTTDAEGRIELYNDAAARLWGRCPEVGVEKWTGAYRILTPEGEPMSADALPIARAVRNLEEIEKVEVIFERPDGTRAHAISHPRAIFDAGGRVVGAINVLVDISERIRNEAELAITKDQLADQVESLTALHNLAMRLGGISELEPALHAIVDTAVEAQRAHFGLVWVHDAATNTLVPRASRGFDARTLEPFGSVQPGPQGGGAGNAFARRCRWAIEDTETDPAFAPFREAARAAGFRALHSTPIVTRSGELLGVLSVHFRQPRLPTQRDMQVADVCARHAADAIETHRNQAALKRSERVYRAIGDSLDFGVWTTDRAGILTYVSDSFLELIGSGFADWRDNWQRLVHPDDVAAMENEWKACVREGRQWDREFRVRGADRKWYAILGRAVPVRDEQGAITGWAGINLDIGRLKQVENELRELDQRKNEFLATLAHELRNPLAPLRNGLEVLRIAQDNKAMTDKARSMMERQLHQMVRLVDDLLDVSRVSRGKIELRRDNVELAAVLRNAIETSQPLMAERGHELVARIPADKIVVYADTTRLSQVFWNLLNNAAKYTEPGGHVDLDVEMGDGTVAVTVRDNGIGIPSEMLSRVFDIFTQVDRSLEKSQGGLGIGLSIARRLVEMHGGRIEARSAGHGKGSTFTVTLPAAVVPRQAEIPAGSAARAGVTPMACRKILIADDNTDSATTLSIMLEMLGNEVRVACDGEEAVAMAKEFRPDAVLMDIGMPRMNGYDACARLRGMNETKKAFMVALTGWGQQEDKDRSRAAGFDHHLVKPVEPAMLESLIAGMPARPAG